jgi:hypothetical protein
MSCYCRQNQFEKLVTIETPHAVGLQVLLLTKLTRSGNRSLQAGTASSGLWGRVLLRVITNVSEEGAITTAATPCIHGITPQKTTISTLTAVATSDHILLHYTAALHWRHTVGQYK